MHRHSFILLTMHRLHNYYPPYPIRLPKDISNKVVEVFLDVNILLTSPRTFNIY